MGVYFSKFVSNSWLAAYECFIAQQAEQALIVHLWEARCLIFAILNYPRSRLNIDTLLAGLGLTQYSDLIRKKNVTFGAFVHMTQQDMINIGIMDETHQAMLLKNLKQLKDRNLNEITNPKPFDANKCLDNVRSQLRKLRGLLAAVNFRVTNDRGNMENLMCDATMSHASLSLAITDKCLNSLDLIESDLKDLKKGKNVIRRSYLKWSVAGGIVTIGALLFLMKTQKKVL